MAQSGDSQDLMGYEALAQEALRGVVKAALKQIAGPGGLPGAHHFYVTFKTRAPGVSIPPELVDRYPDDMTIVLQHEFWDLAPGETFFSVTLKFGGLPKRLSLPYAAVSRFYDPSVQFLLQFDVPSPEATVQTLAPPSVTGGGERGPPRAGSEVLPLRPPPAGDKPEDRPAATAATGSEDEEPDTDGPDDGPKIVSLDQFRKK